ncbi:hypothetical protein HanRHA438_Chr01g0015781 [Helianthus annuus]|uniref:Transmembrane protein n=1 Tax=Helianthus annuus TaxID=4232 RepID=A0A251VMV1_HELAN|nr:uncharacterized protein LOC110868136 [Helianthus annuus]KAF5821568.1 hypothetical protein HanXRQr2_Chr01g0015531 [Helianthus annuus]KAJ0622190.1 hypothetical protein HanIR_Chr01g0017231 [Helianthus annuus]KAJ0947489.1 hypothetical protein HanRHA438_Chr01g0015781 [Helianthus annuus]KAJ0956472.1 hypothetical protein HanPSC8_Chr01g0015211 [Helianthus annuus]
MVVSITTATSLPPFPFFNHQPIKPPNQASLLILSPPPTTLYIRCPSLNRPISATPNGVFLLSEANPPEQIVPAVNDNGDGVSVVISVLLSIAFVGLSVLTLGVIYIGVTDFLQKREKEKFEKEEAEKAKRSGKKKRVRPRVGPKGFGQKIDNDDDL